MTDCVDDYQYSPKEEEEKNDLIKKTCIPYNYNLNVIEEDDENIKNKEDEHLSEEESLGYNSNYKLFQNNSMNKEHQNVKEKTTKRKLSTLSTTISQTDICSETNSFLPPNNLKCQNDRKTSYTQSSHIYFGRERLNSTPVTCYYEGLDFYLRGLQPEKNDYQKTNNYIEKEIFFKEKNIPYKDCKYKSFDLAENKKFNSNQILKNIEENYKNQKNKKFNSNQILKNIEENYKNQNDNKMPLSISKDNSQNNTNNSQNLFMSMTPKFTNTIHGKFDMPMYYFGYYNFDSKYINIILFFSSSV